MKMMRYIIICLLILCCYVNTQAQVNVNNTGVNITFKGATNTSVKGNLILSGDAQIKNDGTIRVSGNFTNNSDNEGFNTSGSGWIEFNGELLQSIAGSHVSEIGKIKLNNAFSLHVLALNKNLTIRDSLIFIDGSIYVVHDTIEVTFKDNSKIVGASDSTYIAALVSKIGNDAFIFPVGKTGQYGPLAMSAPSNATDRFTAEFFDAEQSLGDDKPDSITFVSNCEYWHFERNTGSSNVAISLAWDSTSCDEYSRATSRVLEWNTGSDKWLSLGKANVTGSNARGSVSNNITPSAYDTYFTLGKVIPQTQINAVFQDTLFASLYDTLVADNVGALAYQFWFRDTLTLQTRTFILFDSVGRLSLASVVGLEYGKTYDVCVKGIVGFASGEYGDTIQINITDSIPLSKLKPAYCNIANVEMGDTLEATNIPGSLAYEYLFDDSASVYTTSYKRNSSDPILPITYVPGIQYGKTYYVRVRTYMFNDTSEYGDSCKLRMKSYSLSKLKVIYCDSIGIHKDDSLLADLVGGATAYEFLLEDTASNEFFSFITENDGELYLDSLPNLQYGSFYYTRVRAKIGGGYTNYGDTCIFSIDSFPRTKLDNIFCDSNDVELSDTIFAALVDGAIAYEFHFEDIDATVDSTVRAFSYRADSKLALIDVPNLRYGREYDVRVRATIGNQVGTYGDTCTLTMKTSIPKTKLRTADCNETDLAIDAVVYANAIIGADAYCFHVWESSYDTTIIMAYVDARLDLGLLDSIEYEETYNVSVRSIIAGDTSAYGDTCTISIMDIPLSKLRDGFCDTTNLSLNAILEPELITGSTVYEYVLTDSANLYRDTIFSYSATGEISLAAFDSLRYHRTYYINIRTVIAGDTTDYGDTCKIKTTTTLPGTELTGRYCGQVDLGLDRELYATPVPAATAYQFILRDTAHTFRDTVISTGLYPFLDLDSIENIAYSEMYEVFVRAISFNDTAAFGDTCLFTTIRDTSYNEIVWRSVVGADVDENTGIVTKTAADGWGNAGLSSTNYIEDGFDGWVEYEVDNLEDSIVFGLSLADSNEHYTSIGYGIYQHEDVIRIYEAGVLIGSYGTIVPGDILRVARVGTSIKYYKNGSIFRTSSVGNNAGHLFLDLSMYDRNSLIRDIKFSPLPRTAVGFVSYTDERKNWVQTKVFDGDGKVVSDNKVYSDLLGRVTQDQKRAIDADAVIATHVLYDELGREVAKTLPAPTPYNYINYQDNFITNLEGSEYNYEDFDKKNYSQNTKVLSPGEVDMPEAVNNVNRGSVGWYYSNNNTDEPYVPASPYPFSRQEYYPDPLNRVKRSSGIGENHMLGTGHETRSFYLSSQAMWTGELAYVFGSIDTKPAVKVLTIDSEGREMISYTDNNGNPIATCYSGIDGTCRPQRVIYEMDYQGSRSVDIHLPESKLHTLSLPVDLLSVYYGVEDIEYTIIDLETNTILEEATDSKKNDYVITADRKVQFEDKYAQKSGFFRISFDYTIDFGKSSIVRYMPDQYVELELDYQHWMLYHYDDAGRLIKTVPPEGVDCNSFDLPQATLIEKHEDLRTGAPLYYESALPYVAGGEHARINEDIWVYTPPEEGFEDNYFHDLSIATRLQALPIPLLTEPETPCSDIIDVPLNPYTPDVSTLSNSFLRAVSNGTKGSFGYGDANSLLLNHQENNLQKKYNTNDCDDPAIHCNNCKQDCDETDIDKGGSCHNLVFGPILETYCPTTKTYYPANCQICPCPGVGTTINNPIADNDLGIRLAEKVKTKYCEADKKYYDINCTSCSCPDGVWSEPTLDRNSRVKYCTSTGEYFDLNCTDCECPAGVLQTKIVGYANFKSCDIDPWDAVKPTVENIYRLYFDTYGIDAEGNRTKLNKEPMELAVKLEADDRCRRRWNGQVQTSTGNYLNVKNHQLVPYKQVAVRLAGITIQDGENGAVVSYDQYIARHHMVKFLYLDMAGVQTKIPKPAGESTHTLASEYEYDAQGRLTESETPDGGITEFVYDTEGRVRFSQNAQQRSEDGKYSYTHYDQAGRPVEIGEYDPTEDASTGIKYHFISAHVSPPTLNGTNVDVATLKDDLGNTFGTGDRMFERHYTLYDRKATDLPVSLPGSYSQQYLLGKTSRTENDNSITWYSYDDMGRLEWMVQKIKELDLLKTVEYTYDFNGNITKMAYQGIDSEEDFYHYYTYDKDLRLKTVKTHTEDNEGSAVLQATYHYYKHGPLKRVEMGTEVQGIDYVYNINGWLKSINHPELNGRDPGDDGYSGDHSAFAEDVFGMTIDYHAGDYNRKGTFLQHFNDKQSVYNTNLYNGNIKAIRWQTDAAIGDYTPEHNNTQLMYAYSYDHFDRLSKATFGFVTRPGIENTTANLPAGYYGPLFDDKDQYAERMTYDKSGNIESLYRSGNAGNISMDQFTYNYSISDNRKQNNKLMHVDDAISSVYDTDLDDQSSNNYTYNAIGQLTEDVQGGLEAIEYNLAGKPEAIEADGYEIYYAYDERGNRLKKAIYNGGTPIQNTWYVYDMRGKLMSIYTQNVFGLVQKELPIHCNKRMGHMDLGTDETYYELTDHLGNVRAVVKSEKDDDEAVLLSHADYYPFGMEMSGRNYSTPSYRYGYSGKEKDDEVYSTSGSFYDFGARAYDPRISRWQITDPLAAKYPGISPYTYVANMPTVAIDPDGKLIIFINGHWNTIMYQAGVSPPSGGEAYWNYLDQYFVSSAQQHFGDQNSIFIDASSLFGGDQSGGDRYDLGYQYAKDNYETIVGSLAEGETIKLVSHSEGSAYSAGFAAYFEEKRERQELMDFAQTLHGVKVKDPLAEDENIPNIEIQIQLAPDEADEFSNPKKPYTVRVTSEEDMMSPASTEGKNIDLNITLGDKKNVHPRIYAHTRPIDYSVFGVIQGYMDFFINNPDTHTYTTNDGTVIERNYGE